MYHRTPLRMLMMKIVIDTKDYTVKIDDSESEDCAEFEPMALCNALFDFMSEYINCPNHIDMINFINNKLNN